MVTLRKLTMYLACLTALLLSVAAWGADTALPGKRVLVLNSYHQTYVWTDQEMAGIMRFFHSIDPHYMPQVEYLDWKRYPDPERLSAMRDFLREKYRNVQLDAVITTDNKALEFALEHRALLFPGAAISFCGINGYRDTMIARQERVSGVVENVDPAGTLRLITTLLPQTREIVMLLDDSESSAAVLAQVKQSMADSKGIRLRVLQSPIPSELQQAVSSLAGDSVLLLGPYLRDRDGHTFSFEHTLERVLPHTKVPIFSLWDFLAGKGITGGSLLSGELQGENAARIALRMLKGEERVPVLEKSPTRLLLDYQQLERLGLERNIPPGVEIINRPPSLVRDYLKTLIAIAATMALLVAIIIALALAIRRRHQAEQALRESEERYRTVVDHIPLGISLVGADQHIVMTNRTQAEMLGCTPEDLEGRHHYALINGSEQEPGDTGGETGACPASHDYTHTVIVEGRRLDLHITTAPLQGDGSCSGFVQVVEDVTEAKRAEEEARVQARRMASLYGISQYPFTDERGFLDHALEEVIKLTDSRIGYIYLYSEQKRQFTLNSWSREVMAECAVVEQQQVYDLDETGVWGEAVRQARPIMLNDFTADHPHKRGLPEGHVGLKRFLTVPVMFEGRIVAVVGMANKESDYSEADAMQLTLFMDSVWKSVTAKRAETERLHLEKQLLHAQKLESLGVLAGGIAHDFNNILMTIIGNADLALMRIAPESAVAENLLRIEKAAAQAADLAKQMLAYSGKGKFIVENLDMNRILEEMLHMLEVSISKKAVLRFNYTRPLPPVEADATQMRQIIMNLVINASEAIGDRSGVIAITTGCLECDRSYLNNVWLDDNITEGAYVYLEVADTGCGMDKETLEKIFDPFFTTKFTGRGLGMAAVLGIIRGHRGAIRVYSEPGKGTAFKVLLPASGQPAGMTDHSGSLDDWKGEGTVLLVDDEESVRAIGREMLQNLGYAVLTAQDGREALELYRQTPHISFAILDLTMPHMDGEQCFRALRQANPEVRVIMSSGYNEQEVTQKFVGKGLAGFIQKPYKLSVLKEAIKAMPA